MIALLRATETEIIQNIHKAMETFEKSLHNFFTLMKLSKSTGSSRDLKFISQIVFAFFFCTTLESIFLIQGPGPFNLSRISGVRLKSLPFQNFRVQGELLWTGYLIPPLTLYRHSLFLLCFIFFIDFQQQLLYHRYRSLLYGYAVME